MPSTFSNDSSALWLRKLAPGTHKFFCVDLGSGKSLLSGLGRPYPVVWTEIFLAIDA